MVIVCSLLTLSLHQCLILPFGFGLKLLTYVQLVPFVEVLLQLSMITVVGDMCSSFWYCSNLLVCYFVFLSNRLLVMSQ